MNERSLYEISRDFRSYDEVLVSLRAFVDDLVIVATNVVALIGL